MSGLRPRGRNTATVRHDKKKLLFDPITCCVVVPADRFSACEVNKNVAVVSIFTIAKIIISCIREHPRSKYDGDDGDAHAEAGTLSGMTEALPALPALPTPLPRAALFLWRAFREAFRAEYGLHTATKIDKEVRISATAVF